MVGPPSHDWLSLLCSSYTTMWCSGSQGLPCQSSPPAYSCVPLLSSTFSVFFFVARRAAVSWRGARRAALVARTDCRPLAGRPVRGALGREQAAQHAPTGESVLDAIGRCVVVVVGQSRCCCWLFGCFVAFETHNHSDG